MVLKHSKYIFVYVHETPTAGCPTNKYYSWLDCLLYLTLCVRFPQRDFQGCNLLGHCAHMWRLGTFYHYKMFFILNYPQLRKTF